MARLNGKKGLLVSSLFIIVAVILIIGLVNHSSQKRADVSLIAPQDWLHFQGAKSTSDGIHFDPVGRVLTHKDTSAAQPNPPVNVRGSHLKVSGDFQVEAEMSDIDNGASLWLHGQVPVIYDEWRRERGSIKIEASGAKLVVSIWDGTSPSSIDERAFKMKPTSNAKIILSHIDGNIRINVGKNHLDSMPDHGIFAKGTVWVGADASINSPGWVLSSLKARGLNEGRVELVPPPNPQPTTNQPDTLKNLASKHPRSLPIGTAVSIYPLFTDDQYSKLVVDQFSIITPENSLKPQFVHPQKNTYAFQDADSLVDFAQTNKIQVHGHSLVMGKANPQWLQKTPEKERQQTMTDHISNVVGHFKGKIAGWDVVNEPLSEDDIDYTNGRMGLRKQMWFDAMGETYIDTAFRSARTADPSAKLYLNDFGMEKDGKRWDAMLALVKRLQARGVPIDGVGFESHIYHEPDLIDPAVLQRHIQQLAELGITSRVSEIDVLGDNLGTQASQYADILRVCLAEPTCTSYTTWGVSDLYGSTALSDRYPTKLGHSLLWSDKYNAKPALDSLKNTLKQY